MPRLKKAPAKKETDRIAAILAGLDELYPDAHCELNYETPFQLLESILVLFVNPPRGLFQLGRRRRQDFDFDLALFRVQYG